jgi:catechol 2,3-dioxygenase
MDDLRLPDSTHIGHVHLQVADLGRAFDFYSRAMGFREVSREDGVVSLSASGGWPVHLRLSERPGAPRKPHNATGLFHVAIRLPDRQALARLLQRLLEHQVSLLGASDHKVSEAIYLQDPDGNGLELYTDRARELWPRQDGQIAMTTDPLDLDDLLRAGSPRIEWEGLHPETDIGHVHLQGNDLAQAEAFYHGLLGLAVTQRTYPGALFMSAGGYHHHVAVNIWASRGGPPAPPEAAGLLSFALRIPDRAAWEAAIRRLEQGGVLISERNNYPNTESVLVKDPFQIGVELLTDRSNGGTS